MKKCGLCGSSVPDADVALSKSGILLCSSCMKEAKQLGMFGETESVHLARVQCKKYPVRTVIAWILLWIMILIVSGGWLYFLTFGKAAAEGEILNVLHNPQDPLVWRDFLAYYSGFNFMTLIALLLGISICVQSKGVRGKTIIVMSFVVFLYSVISDGVLFVLGQ